MDHVFTFTKFGEFTVGRTLKRNCILKLSFYIRWVWGAQKWGSSPAKVCKVWVQREPLCCADSVCASDWPFLLTVEESSSQLLGTHSHEPRSDFLFWTWFTLLKKNKHFSVNSNTQNPCDFTGFGGVIRGLSSMTCTCKGRSKQQLLKNFNRPTFNFYKANHTSKKDNVSWRNEQVRWRYNSQLRSKFYWHLPLHCLTSWSMDGPPECSPAWLLTLTWPNVQQHIRRHLSGTWRYQSSSCAPHRQESWGPGTLCFFLLTTCLTSIDYSALIFHQPLSFRPFTYPAAARPSIRTHLKSLS
jgi:hypothetical protein